VHPEPFDLRRVARFIRAHLKWVLLGPLIMVLGTTVHELVHCGAALLTGGTIVEIHLLPTRLDRFVFGYMEAVGDNDFATKIAPALLSSCVATFAYAWQPAPRFPKLCFVLFYLLPLFDVAMAVTGALRHIETADLWVLQDHLPALALASLVFFGAHLWAVPKLFHDGLSAAEVRLLVAVFLLSPVLRFL
jgi:hypothetical protein